MKNLRTLNSKRAKQRAFAILITLLMTLSFIANVGAVVVDLTPDYAKPGNTIDILSYEIVGPDDGAILNAVNIGYNGTDPLIPPGPFDVECANLYIDDNLVETLYGPVGEFEPEYFVPEGVTITVKLEFMLSATAVHDNHVDGYVSSYTMSKPGSLPGTDPQPIDPLGYTIIDAVKPTVKSVTVVPNPAIEGAVTVTVKFSEGPMNNSVNPTVTVEGLLSSYTVNEDSYIGNIWIGTFTLDDEGDATHAHISVSDGQDLAGNVMVAKTEAGTFAIDTKEPTVTTLTVSPILLTDAEEGFDAFTVTVDYSEAMKGVAPTITFDPTVTSTLTLASGIWIDADTYEATYDVADAGVTFDDVKVIVEDAEDLAGNVQVAYTKSDAFDIDTENPTVSIEVSDDMISDPDVPGPFEVTATFSEAMDPAYIPDISFDQIVSSTLISPSGAWSEGDTVYTVSYSIFDVEQEADDVGVIVGGAKDFVGNDQIEATAANLFSIDMLAPMAPYILDAPLYINIANQHAYPVFGFAEPGSTVEVRLTTYVLLHTATKTGPSDGAFSIAVDASILEDDMVFVDSRATDAAGNTGGWSVQIQRMKDTKAPTVAIAIPDPINQANVALVPVTITSDEAGTYSYVISDGTNDVTWSELIVAGTPVELSLNLVTLLDGPITADASVEDAAGNVGHAPTDTATKDTIQPDVNLIVVSDTMITEADVLGAFEVTVTFSEAMDPAYDPTIIFLPDVEASGTLTFSGGMWTSDTVYTATYTVDDVNEERDVKINVDGAYDIAGNDLPYTIGDIMFYVDTIAPEITSIHWSVGSMPDVVGVGNEITITLIGEAGCTATFDIVGTKTLADHEPMTGGLMGTYTGSYTVQVDDDGYYLINGYLMDAAGNVASIIGTYDPPAELDSIEAGTTEWSPDESHSGRYSVKLYVGPPNLDIAGVCMDTDVPLGKITELSFWKLIESFTTGRQPNLYLFVDADDSGTLDFTVEDIMQYDNSSSPRNETIHGDDAVIWFETSGYLTEPDTAWSERNIFTDYYCWVTDRNGRTGYPNFETIQSDGLGVIDPENENKVMKVVILTGSGAWRNQTTYIDDIRINNVIYNLEKPFRIDTIPPDVTITVSDDLINEYDIPGPFKVTATYGEPMDTTVAPIVGFIQDVEGSGTLYFSSGVWTSDTVYTATYTIADEDEWVLGVAVTAKGAEDIAGNPQAEYVSEALFDVDTYHGIDDPVSIEVKANGEDSLTVTIVDEVDIVATVWNWFNETISGGVNVSFTTDLGEIWPTEVTTVDGSAQTSIPLRDIGIANVTATAGGVSDTCTITFVEKTLEIELSLGWNLISVPRTLANSSIEEVFAGITTIEKVWTYQDGNWSGAKYIDGVWIPIPGYLLEKVDDGKGYWVYTSEPNNITIKLKPLEYLETPPYYTLSAQWSLIGYTTLQLEPQMPVEIYLNNLKDIWIVLYNEGYEISKPSFGFNNFELGRGYWIYLNAAGTLVP